MYLVLLDNRTIGTFQTLENAENYISQFNFNFHANKGSLFKIVFSRLDSGDVRHIKTVKREIIKEYIVCVNSIPKFASKVKDEILDYAFLCTSNVNVSFYYVLESGDIFRL